MTTQNQTAQTSEPASAEIPEAIQGKSLKVTPGHPLPNPQPEGDAKLKTDSEDKTTRTMEGHAVFVNDLHTYIRGHIQLADQKAAFLFAATGAMLAFLHSKSITKIWMKDPRHWLAPEALAFVAVAGLVLGSLASFWVIVPRLKGAPRGIIYWKAISLFETKNDYAQHILACSGYVLISAKLEHCYEIANICRKKYKALSWGLWCGGIGLLAAILYLAFS